MPSNKYTEKIAGAMTHKPSFEWFVYQLTETFRENTEFLETLYKDFDLDSAVGPQLDAVGVRVGAFRTVIPPIEGAEYFSLDVKHSGFDEAIWYRQYVDTATIVKTLDDDSFRFLIRCKVKVNSLDGSREGLEELIQMLKNYYDIDMTIKDNQDMSIQFVVNEENVPIVMKHLLTGGYLNIKPAGVKTEWETADGNQ